MVPVDVKWDRNIYFSVKTTAKYFKERLSVLITSWFQVINKEMVSVKLARWYIVTLPLKVYEQINNNLVKASIATK